MVRTIELKLAGKKVAIRELTIKEIINLRSLPRGVEILDGFFDRDHAQCIGMLSHCSGLTVDEILRFGVHDYRTALNTLMEVNADFFEIWGDERKKKPTAPLPSGK